jgi:V/A-type H+-transporting ATPase subunit E
MTQDLQQLLDKIQRDGVDKAKVQAETILEKANAQALALVDHAKTEAASLLSAAQQEAEAFERRAEETIRQSARDTVLSVERSVTLLLTNLLLKDVQATLNSAELTTGLILEAVRAYLAGKGTVEVAVSSKLAEALRAKLASEAVSGVTVTTDESAGAGFRIRLANGRIEHDFTAPAIAEALARPLRPRLAALLKSQ